MRRKALPRAVTLAAAASVALLALLAGGSARAAEARSDFAVMVKLIREAKPIGPPQGPEGNPDSSERGDFCRGRNVPAAFGANVTVVCSTGLVVDVSPGEGLASWQPMHGAAYRFLLPFSWAGVMSVDPDISTGLGTVTSWRVVRLVDRMFLEMTVHW